MKKLNTFLEGLLDKSNKTGTIDAKEFIISTIENRFEDTKSDFSDRIITILDVLKTTYKSVKALKVGSPEKPRCFISASTDRTGYILNFIWLRSGGEKYYWKVNWSLRANALLSKNLTAIFDGTSMTKSIPPNQLALYEIPEEDMKDYFRTVNELGPLPSYYGKDKRDIIQQIIN